MWFCYNIIYISWICVENILNLLIIVYFYPFYILLFLYEVIWVYKPTVQLSIFLIFCFLLLLYIFHFIYIDFFIIYNIIHNISVVTILLVKEFVSINLYVPIIIVFLLIIPRILFNTTYFCLNDKIIFGWKNWFFCGNFGNTNFISIKGFVS